MQKLSCKALLTITLLVLETGQVVLAASADSKKQAQPAAKAGQPPLAVTDKKTVPAEVFEQKSLAEGQVVLTITDVGVRVDFPQQNIVCITRAPAWVPKIINTKAKTGFEYSHLSWYDSGYHVADEKQLAAHGTQHPEDWRGHAALRIVRHIDESDPLRGRAEFLFREGHDRSVDYNSETMLYANWLNLKPEPAEFLRGLYHLRSPNMVLQRTHFYPNGRQDAVLDTVSYKQVAAVPISIFDDPVVYDKAANKDGVTFEKSRKKQAFGILEDMFDDSDTGAKHKPTENKSVPAPLKPKQTQPQSAPQNQKSDGDYNL